MSALSKDVISIGCQAGSPEAGVVAELSIPLRRALSKHVTSSYCEAIDEYAIVLRIDGSLWKFGEEGIARLRFARTRRYISVDIQVPESVWRLMTQSQTKVYLVRQVKAALSTCVSRLQKERCVVAEHDLLARVEAAAGEYLQCE